MFLHLRRSLGKQNDPSEIAASIRFWTIQGDQSRGRNVISLICASEKHDSGSDYRSRNVGDSGDGAQNAPSLTTHFCGVEHFVSLDAPTHLQDQIRSLGAWFDAECLCEDQMFIPGPNPFLST